MLTLSKVPEENKDTWGTILTCFRLEFIVLHCTYHAETATVKVIDDYEGSDLEEEEHNEGIYCFHRGHTGGGNTPHFTANSL